MLKFVIILIAIILGLPVFSMKTIEIEVDSLAFGNNVVIDSILSDVIGTLEKYNKVEPRHTLTMYITHGEDCEFIHLDYIPDYGLTDRCKYTGFVMYKGYMVLIGNIDILSLFNLSKTTAKRTIRVKHLGKFDFEVLDPLNWIYILHQNEFFLVYGFPYKSIAPKLNNAE